MDALQVANIEHHVIRTQFKGVWRALEYLAELAYKVYVKGHEDFPNK